MTDDQNTPEPVKPPRSINARDAREQASEGGYSVLKSTFIKLGGEEFEIPNRDLFDPDQQDRFEELLDSLHDYDREPDITSSDGTVIRRGDLIVPHRKNGKLVKPSWSERLGVALWGEAAARRYRAAGGNFNRIEIEWAKQARALRKWREADSKSVDRDSGVESVPD